MQMVFAMVLKLLSLLALSSLVTAAIVPPPKPLIPKVKVRQGPVFDRNGTSIPPYNTVYEFDQLIDHTNPGLGTFKQRYWHTWEFYQPGQYLFSIISTEVVSQWNNHRRTNNPDVWRRGQCGRYEIPQWVVIVTL